MAGDARARLVRLTAVAVALTVALSTTTEPVSALFFRVKEGSVRCFLEEVPKDTLVVGDYKSPDTKGGATAKGINVKVTSPTNDQMVDRDLGKKGRFAFTSVVGGEHKLCFTPNSTSWMGTPEEFKFELKLNVGEMAIDYDEVAKKEHLSTLEVEVRKLNDKMRDVMKQQAYQRDREKAFRNTSESTNSRVQWWSIFQTVVVVLSGLYQISVLKSFFKSKKFTARTMGRGHTGWR